MSATRSLDDRLLDHTTGWSALLATLFHLGLLALPLLPQGCEGEPGVDPDSTPSPETTTERTPPPTADEQLQPVVQLPDEALTPAPAALRAEPEPLPDLDLADLPPLDEATSQAIAAARTAGSAGEQREGATAQSGGAAELISPVSQAADVALHAELPAERSAQEVDAELRQWQEAVEVLDSVFFRKLWLARWKPRYGDRVSAQRICARVTIDEHDNITDFVLISGTGISELDARIELAFKGARKPFGLTRIDAAVASRPVWLTLW